MLHRNPNYNLSGYTFLAVLAADCVERLHILYKLYVSLQVQNVTMWWHLSRIRYVNRISGHE